MSETKRTIVDHATNALAKRRALRESGAVPAPLNQEWQKDLRAVLEAYLNARPQLSRDQAYFFFLAELLRWMRDEEGWDADVAAELSAGYADVFPVYGGDQKAEGA